MGDSASSRIGLPKRRPRTNANTNAATASWIRMTLAGNGRESQSPDALVSAGTAVAKSMLAVSPARFMAKAALSARRRYSFDSAELPPSNTTEPSPRWMLTEYDPGGVFKHDTARGRRERRLNSAIRAATRGTP